MIITILGDVGSGKSLTAQKTIIKRKRVAFTNFDSKSKYAIRLKRDDIIKEITNDKGKVTGFEVNWEFWDNAKRLYKQFDIYIDEIHNLFPARGSMRRENIEGMKWIAQIRKVLGDSKKSNIYLISQRLARIDIAWRDLTQYIIHCVGLHKGEKFIVMQYHFLTDIQQSSVDKYERWMVGHKSYTYRTAYKGNPYFKTYNTFEVIGRSEWL